MTTESPLPPTHHRLDIQGLRAVAVLGVVVFHAFHPALPGGFVGVDIFFVLSGFLITGILLKDMDAGRFSLRGFYKRRVRRLFPALFVVMAFTLAAGLVLLAPQALKELSLTQFFTNLFVSNLAFIRISGYFDPDASLRPLLHTWSLGVEEQFYLLFPPILLALHRFARRLLWPVVAVLALWSLYEAQHFLSTDTVKAFYHPFARAVELLIGAMCVGVVRHVSLSARVRTLLSWAGLLVLGGSLVFLNDRIPFPGLWALPPCLGTAALLVAQDGPANRRLGIRPLVVVGDMSYSLYLWHWPLLVYAHLAFGLSAGVTAGAVVVAFVAAWLSRRYVEEPFLIQKPGSQKPWPIWWMALGATAVSILACVAIYNADGVPQRFNAPERALFAAAEDFNHDRPRCHKRSNGTLPYERTCVYGDLSAVPSVAVWSDSIGAELSPPLGEIMAERGQSVRSITASGCPAEVRDRDANCNAHNAQILTHLSADPNIRTVVLIANYLGYLKDPRPVMPDSLLEAAAALRQAGKQVIIVAPLPAYDFDPPSEAGMALRFGRDPGGLGMSTAQYDQANGPTIAALTAFAAPRGIQILSVRDLFCWAGRCRVYDPAVGVLYYNSLHLSLTGARRIAQAIGPLAAPPARPAMR